MFYTVIQNYSTNIEPLSIELMGTIKMINTLQIILIILSIINLILAVASFILTHRKVYSCKVLRGEDKTVETNYEPF